MPPSPHTFLRTKKKKKRKKRKAKEKSKSFKVATKVKILERLELKNLSCWPIMVADNIFQSSMVPLLCNPYCRPCKWLKKNTRKAFLKTGSAELSDHKIIKKQK